MVTSKTTETLHRWDWLAQRSPPNPENDPNISSTALEVTGYFFSLLYSAVKNYRTLLSLNESYNQLTTEYLAYENRRRQAMQMGLEIEAAINIESDFTVTDYSKHNVILLTVAGLLLGWASSTKNSPPSETNDIWNLVLFSLGATFFIYAHSSTSREYRQQSDTMNRYKTELDRLSSALSEKLASNTQDIKGKLSDSEQQRETQRLRILELESKIGALTADTNTLTVNNGELILENDQLKIENAQLKGENDQLKGENDQLQETINRTPPPQRFFNRASPPREPDGKIARRRPLAVIDINTTLLPRR